jgi:hypothetical protein
VGDAGVGEALGFGVGVGEDDGVAAGETHPPSKSAATVIDSVLTVPFAEGDVAICRREP